MDTDALFPDYKEKFKSLLILGPPGSKKDSICKSLSCLGDFFYLSFKEILKQLDPLSSIGELCQKYISKGFPIPDEIAIGLWERYMEGLINAHLYHPKNQLLILEGFPLNIHQAKALEKSIEVICVISLTVNHLRFLDQEEKTIQSKKMHVYKEETIKVLSLYPQTLVISINADQRLIDVFKDILIAIHNKI